MFGPPEGSKSFRYVPSKDLGTLLPQNGGTICRCCSCFSKDVCTLGHKFLFIFGAALSSSRNFGLKGRARLWKVNCQTHVSEHATLGWGHDGYAFTLVDHLRSLADSQRSKIRMWFPFGEGIILDGQRIRGRKEGSRNHCKRYWYVLITYRFWV